MRVLFCKIQCPLMCFRKLSATHIYTSGSVSGQLKLESAPHIIPSTACAVSSEEGLNGNEEALLVLKSCIRKLPPGIELGKKRVQWMDNLGKELAEIKGFGASDTEDTDNEEEKEESSRRVCVIL